MLSADGPITLKAVEKIIEPLNVPAPQKVGSGRGMIRYFIHLDNPEKWIWVNTSDTICENFFEIPAGEYLIVSTSRQTKTVWPLIEAMKLKPCGNLAKKM